MQTQELETLAEQERFVREAIEKADEHRKKKRFKEGIDLLVEALRFGLEKETIYFRLGNIYIDAGDLNRAEYAYKRALEVEPHYANAMHNLAIVYKRQKKIDLYVRTYKKSQRMAIRYPKRSNLSPEVKGTLRRDAWKLFGIVLAVIIAAVAVVAILRR
ncbi:MAG: tetratricopeptide repeat protein [Candidatus Bipolaricaulota bacterium]|nr:MAG: tetratricopeptide repeat protein [Candidatus Bipolaricaulota bacterium]